MIDVESIIHRLESEGLLRTHKISGDYYTIYCPFHNDGHESRPSCGILLVDQVKNGTKYPAGFTHCFTCGFARSLPDMITELLKIHNISGSGFEWLKENVPGFDGFDVDFEPLLPKDTIMDLNAKYAVDYVYSLSNKPKYNFVSEEELESYRLVVDYMYERKLTDELIEKFDVGFDPNFIPKGRKKAIPCITFPVRDKDGNTLFICRRSIVGKFFNYPENVTKPVYGLYELPEHCQSVVICESCINALTSWRYGRPAVALLGTSNDYQIKQLKMLGAKEFILALDPDEAGERATRKLQRALKDSAIVWRFEGIPEGKDLNDLTKEEFDNLEIV